MLPFISIFGQSVQTYHLCAAAAGICGILLAVFCLRRCIKGVWRVGLPVLIAVCALVGARLLNFFTNPDAYGTDFHLWTLSYEKLSLMGGLISGVLAVFVYALCAKKHALALLDAFTVPAAVSTVLLKLGCFLNGCCHGKPTESIFGTEFPANAAKYDFINSLPLVQAASDRVHPTQLYELIGALSALALALLLSRKAKKPGCRFAVFAGVFSLVRLLVLPLRQLPYAPAVISVVYPCLYGAVIAVCAGIFVYSQVGKQMNVPPDRDLNK